MKRTSNGTELKTLGKRTRVKTSSSRKKSSSRPALDRTYYSDETDSSISSEGAKSLSNKKKGINRLHSNSQLTPNLPFYMNVLEAYPREDSKLQPHHLKFPWIFKHNSQTPSSIMMTCFGFDSQLIQNSILGLNSNSQNSSKSSPKLSKPPKLLLLQDSPKGNFSIEERLFGLSECSLIEPAKVHMGYGFGAFHPKLWLIRFGGDSSSETQKSILRVVVTSGNLSSADWTIWGNCLWYQDFLPVASPKKILKIARPKNSPNAGKDSKEKDSNKKLTNSELKNDFGAYLKNFVNNLMPVGLQTLKKKTDICLDDFDFSVEVKAHLMASKPGKYNLEEANSSVNSKTSKTKKQAPGKASISAEDEIKYGFERLREIMVNNPFRTKAATSPLKKRIVYQTSSVGQLSIPFLLKLLGKLLILTQIV